MCDGNGYTNYQQVKRMNKLYSFFTRIINFFSNVKTNVNITKDNCTQCNGTGNELSIMTKKKNNFIKNIPKKKRKKPPKSDTYYPRLKVNSFILKPVLRKKIKIPETSYAGW